MMFTPEALLRVPKISLRLVRRLKFRSMPSMERGFSWTTLVASALTFIRSRSSAESASAFSRASFCSILMSQSWAIWLSGSSTRAFRTSESTVSV